MSADLHAAIEAALTGVARRPEAVLTPWDVFADALLDGPLRETLRLARIGAWVEDHLPICDTSVDTARVQPAWEYRTEAIATGEPPEPEKAT